MGLKWKDEIKILQENGAWKQVGVAIHISDETNFKWKLVRRDRKGHFTLIKGTNHEKVIL
jgi:hypothetical protein